VYKYYRSQNILTLLKSTDKNLFLDNLNIELFCNVLTGQIVNWFETTNWLNCTYDTNQKVYTSLISDLCTSETKEITFDREKLHKKSEFDSMDSSTSNDKMLPNVLSSLSLNEQISIVEITSKLFNVQLNKNVGTILAAFWMSLENGFVENMERCFFYRRILMYEKVPFIITVDNYFDKMLYKPNSEKIDLVKRLQYNLINIPKDTMTISDPNRYLLRTLLDEKLILIQMINQKIEKCLHFIEDKTITNWLEKQINSIFNIYMCMLQVEVCIYLYVYQLFEYFN
jgi:hypothetical protein